MNFFFGFLLGVLTGPVVIKVFKTYVAPLLKKLWGKVDDQVDKIPGDDN